MKLRSSFQQEQQQKAKEEAYKIDSLINSWRKKNIMHVYICSLLILILTSLYMYFRGVHTHTPLTFIDMVSFYINIFILLLSNF